MADRKFDGGDESRVATVQAIGRQLSAKVDELQADNKRLREGVLRIQDDYVREYGIGASSDFIVVRVGALLDG